MAVACQRTQPGPAGVQQCSEQWLAVALRRGPETHTVPEITLGAAVPVSFLNKAGHIPPLFCKNRKGPNEKKPRMREQDVRHTQEEGGVVLAHAGCRHTAVTQIGWL